MTSYVLTLIGNTKPEPLTTAHIEHVCMRLRLTYSNDWLPKRPYWPNKKSGLRPGKVSILAARSGIRYS